MATQSSRLDLSGSYDAAWLMLRGYDLRAWLMAMFAAVAALFLIGIPTRLVANGWFIRMTPTRTQDYVFWIASAALIGLIAGSYATRRSGAHEYKVASGGVLSYLAVGCPICNKIVVMALGVSGAMTYFAPAQLFIGAASVALLAWTFLLRARALTTTCDLPASADGARS